MKEQVEFKSKSIFSEGGVFKESQDENGKPVYYYETTILPFGETSRNGVKYNEQSARQNGVSLVGKNMFYNHITNGNDSKDLPRGEWEEVMFDKTSMSAKARIFNTKYNEDFIAYLKEAKNPRSSLQVTGSAKQMKEEKTGKYYREAYIEEFLEASVVGIPGFDAAKGSMAVAIAEAFGNTEPTDKLVEEETNTEFFTNLEKIRKEINNK